MALFGMFGKKKETHDVPAVQSEERAKLTKALDALNEGMKDKGKEYVLFQCPNRCVNADIMDKDPHQVYVQANPRGDPSPSCPTCGATMLLIDL